MKRRDILNKISRREVLKGAGVLAVAGGVGARHSASALGWKDTTFVVEQGDTCVAIEPLSGRGNVVDLYGYEPDASAENSQQSNTGLEEPSVSRVFLYDGPEGLSLVFLQGGGEGEPGGAASFHVCGLSATGKWVVLDDDYSGSADEFLLSNQEAVLNWAWGEQGRNDGGVFRGFDQPFCVTIDPAFDESAKLKPFGSGTVTDWQLLSGNGDTPEVVNLDMDEPVTIRTGDCSSESRGCTMNTVSNRDPFDAVVSFCCLSAVVEADEYDWVRLNFQDGTDERFDGPFTGLNGFVGTDDGDGNVKERIVRSIVVSAGGERLQVENPNADRCLTTVTKAEQEGTEEGTPTGEGEGTPTG